jgi:hypothetical protein
MRLVIIVVILLTMNVKPQLPAKGIFNDRVYVLMTNGVGLHTDSAVQYFGLIVTSKQFVSNILVLRCIMHFPADQHIPSPGFRPNEKTKCMT